MFSYMRSADELMAQQEPDELPIQTNTPCPTCGRLVEWDGDRLYCQPCDLVWNDFTELQLDAQMQRRRRYNQVARQINDEERRRVVAAAYEFGRAHLARTEAAR